MQTNIINILRNLLTEKNISYFLTMASKRHTYDKSKYYYLIYLILDPYQYEP